MERLMRVRRTVRAYEEKKQGTHLWFGSPQSATEALMLSEFYPKKQRPEQYGRALQAEGVVSYFGCSCVQKSAIHAKSEES